jgi:O-antigen ligase
MVSSNRFFSGLAIAMLLFFAVASFVFEGMQQLALWIAVPSSAVFAFIAVPHHRASVYMRLQIILYLWIAFTALFAINLPIAMSQLRRLVGCFLSIYAINQLAKDYKLTKWLYIVYLVFYVGMVYYASTHILTEEFDYTEDRLDDSKLNANMIAYFTFFTTYIVFIMADIAEKPWGKVLFRWLFLLSPIWSFVAAVLTGSRQIIVIQVPLVIVLFYLRYLRERKVSNKIIFVLIAVVVGFFAIRYASSIYEGSYLSQRNEDSYMEDSRIMLIRDAFEVGITHPIVGVGPGGFGKFKYGRSFSHNNYVELFANSGLLAMVLCIAMYWIFIKTQWRRFKQTRDKMFLTFLVFGIMYVVDNMFYVFYSNTWLMAFFFLVAMHADNFYKYNYSDPKVETSIHQPEHE